MAGETGPTRHPGGEWETESGVWEGVWESWSAIKEIPIKPLHRVGNSRKLFQIRCICDISQ